MTRPAAPTKVTLPTTAAAASDPVSPPDARLQRLDPLAAIALAVHGATVLINAPWGASWVVVLVAGVLGVAGMAGWRSALATMTRAIGLCVAATYLAAAGGGPRSPFVWWYAVVIGVYGLAFSAQVSVGVTIVACACYVALMGVVPPDQLPSSATWQFGGLVVLGWLVWRVGSVYAEAIGDNRRLAFTDALTGLPNRAVLMDHLSLALARASRTSSFAAVLFLDLDDFKVVNDSLGHETGDELLVEASKRLLHVMRPTDTVARFGGDEFIILCEDISGPADAVAVAERALQCLQPPVDLHGKHVKIAASIGIALGRGGTESGEDLLRDADAAMYRAKSRGRGHYEIFDTNMRAQMTTRLTMESNLRRALAQDELRLVYQPQIRLGDDHTAGYEALLRWQVGDQLVSPREFIPLAEETGLIVPIGEWVFHEACQQSVRWQQQGRETSISVNVSARQFSDSALLSAVASSLAETSANASSMCLEITETAAMNDLDNAVVALWRVRDLGLAIHIDDFGTGYSSLSQLRRFPVTALKIDRSFVAEINGDAQSSAITVAIITLAHSLGMAAVAEGVENAQQLAVLRRLGCDFAQGFHLGRPELPERPNDHDTRRDPQASPASHRRQLLLEELKKERHHHD